MSTTTEYPSCEWPNAERAARYAEWRDWLALRRSERPAGIRAERPDHTAAQTAALSAAKRRRLAERDETRKRDEWQRRMAGVQLDGAEILRRCARAVASVNGATDQERDDALGELVLSVGKRHGWRVPATALSQSLLERRAHDRIIDARLTAERRHTVSMDALGGEDERVDQRRSAWMAALGKRTARKLRRSALAGETGASELWLRLSVVAGAELHSDERAALAAALMDARSGPALAEQMGMTPGALRVKLTRGRKLLAERYPTPDALADALADAQRYGAADDERVRLTAAERRAERLTAAAADRTADLARSASRKGRSHGRSFGPQPVTLAPALSHSRLVLWLAASGRLPAAAALRARRATAAELADRSRRRCYWQQRRAWRLRIRAAALALASDRTADAANG